MTLGAQIVYFVGLYVPEDLVDGTGIVQVTVVEKEPYPCFVGIMVNMVYPAGIER
jgi:hypothetical protein